MLLMNMISWRGKINNKLLEVRLLSDKLFIFENW